MPGLAEGIDAATLAAVRVRGWGLAPAYMAPAQTLALHDAVLRLTESGGLPPGCHAFFDRLDSGEMRLARLERVADALPLLQGELGARMAADAARCLGGPVVAFKDKLNLRYPGSAGYAPHQDGARWDRFARRFLSFGLFLSPSDAARGGFEIAIAEGVTGRLPNRRGDLIAADYARLPRQEVQARPGDALLIDGDVPHCTTDNRSGDTILHLLVTYALTDDPAVRAAYYADQHHEFAGANVGGNVFAFRAR